MKTRRELLEDLLKYFEVITNKSANEKYTDVINQFIYNEIKISNEELEIVFTHLKDSIKKYPTRVDINDAITFIKKNKSKYKQVTRSTSQVRTSPEKTKGELLGIPTSIETLCMMIDRNETASGAFMGTLHRLGLSEADLWAIYEARAEGKLHPVVEDYRKRKGYIK